MNRLTLLAAALAALIGWGEASAGEVRLMAAASLKEAVNELADAYSRKAPGTSFTKIYGGSGILAKQVENGAPADIFIAASREWTDYLRGRNLISDPTVIATNRLVVVGSGASIAGMKDLRTLRRIAIGSPKSVPAGEYALQALKKADLEAELAGRLVIGKDVREALMYAERGEVDGAFVYRTDALVSRKIKILFTVPQELHEQIVYPAALTASGAKRNEAISFFRFIQSPDGKKILERHGFR